MGIFDKFKKKKRAANQDNTTEIVLAEMDHLIKTGDFPVGYEPDVSIHTTESNGVFTVEIKTLEDNNPRTIIQDFKGSRIEHKIMKWLSEQGLERFSDRVMNSISINISSKK